MKPQRVLPELYEYLCSDVNAGRKTNKELAVILNTTPNFISHCLRVLKNEGKIRIHYTESHTNKIVEVT